MAAIGCRCRSIGSDTGADLGRWANRNSEPRVREVNSHSACRRVIARPGITSPDFQPENYKDFALQYHVALILAGSLGASETARLLESMTSRWDKVSPAWRRLPACVAPIEMARGRSAAAVELALQDLETGLGLLWAWDWRLRYEQIFYFKALTSESAIAERLAILRAEADAGGVNLRAYLNELQSEKATALR